MKFLRKYVIICTTWETGSDGRLKKGSFPIAYFNTLDDCKEVADRWRKNNPYSTFEIYKKISNV